jgi:cysteinyl-tRNA synthetase
MVTIDGTKMGKSLGNSLNIQQVINGDHPRLSQPYPPLALRFFILSSHYRQNTDFTDEALQGAARGHERLLNTVARIRQNLANTEPGEIDAQVVEMIDQVKDRFHEAMDNDFNTPQALAALFDFNRLINGLVNSDQVLSGATLLAIDSVYRSLGGDVLGVIPEQISSGGGEVAGREDSLIKILVDLRAAARKNKDYATSDAIRDQLSELGITLQDGPDGTTWK